MNSKLFLKYITKYLGILGVFWLLMIPVYISAYQGSKKTALSVADNQLNQGVIDMDNEINKMKIITELLRNNQEIKKLAKIQGTPETEDYAILNKAQDYMKSCFVLGTVEGREFLLFRNNNVVITTNEIASNSMYHDYSLYGQSDMDFVEFQQYIFDNKKWIQYLPLMEEDRSVGITCILKSPSNLGVKDAYDTALVFEVSQDILNQAISIDKDSELDFAYITDSDGEIIYDINYQGEALDAETLKMGRVSYQGEKYALLQVQAQTSGLQWVVGISSKSYGQTIINVNRIIWLYLVLCIVLTIVFCIVWAVRNAVSMWGILQSLKYDGTKKLPKNEYRYISSEIIGLHGENEIYRSKIDSLQKTVSDNVMNRLLTHGIYTEKEKEEIQNYLNWYMEFYCVVCILAQMEKENEILSCFSRTDEFFEKHFSCMMAMKGMSERIYILEMNKTDETNTSGISSLLKKFVAEQEGILIGISSIGTGIENVQLCYWQANLMIRQIAGTYDVKVQEFQGQIENYDKSFKRNLGNRIYDLVLAEEKENLETLFKKIKYYAVKHVFETEEEMQMFFFEIQKPIARILDEMENGGLPERKFPTYRYDRTIMDMVDDLEGFVYYLCDCIHKGKENSRNAFCEKMLLIVEENYNNKDMCVSLVASRLGVSDKHLMVVFKEKTGENFSSYVENRRMQMVEKYLLETDWSMAKIADAVGYNTIDAFYKAFKKNYGLAPKKWKENRRL